MTGKEFPGRIFKKSEKIDQTQRHLDRGENSMKTKLSVQQYILMPVRGFRAIRPFSTSSVVNFFISIAGGGRVGPQAFGRQKSAPLKMRVLDSIHEDGPKLDLTGPGVGVLSTVRGGYAPMSGTSMACPAVTGFAAKMLSKPGHRNILNMPRDQARSDAMAQALLQAAKTLGFGPRYEGKGLPL